METDDAPSTRVLRYERGDGARRRDVVEIELYGTQLLRWDTDPVTGERSIQDIVESPDPFVRFEYAEGWARRLRAEGYGLVAGREPWAEEPADAAPPARNAELEEAILAEPDDDRRFLVYGDWLLAQGDPRGELIGLQAARERITDDDPDADAKRQEVFRAEDVLLYRHRRHFHGPLLAEQLRLVAFEWKLGFIRGAHVRVDPEAFQAGVRVPALLEALFTHASGAFVRELQVGIAECDGSNGYQAVIDALARLRPRALASLFLGDFVRDESELSWSSLGDASPLYAALPRLRSLRLRSGRMALGRVELPELREFAAISGGLSRDAVRAICEARWPKLESLEVWFGRARYGGDAGLGDIPEILRGEGVPALRHLGLVNAEFSEALCAALPDAPVLRRIRTLDLSKGTMTDADAAALLARRDAFAHLERLDVSGNYLTDDGVARLEGICRVVVASDQRALTEHDEGRRYAAVGE